MNKRPCPPRIPTQSSGDSLSFLFSLGVTMRSFSMRIVLVSWCLVSLISIVQWHDRRQKSTAWARDRLVWQAIGEAQGAKSQFEILARSLVVESAESFKSSHAPRPLSRSHLKRVAASTGTCADVNKWYLWGFARIFLSDMHDLLRLLASLSVAADLIVTSLRLCAVLRCKLCHILDGWRKCHHGRGF